MALRRPALRLPVCSQRFAGADTIAIRYERSGNGPASGAVFLLRAATELVSTGGCRMAPRLEMSVGV